MTKLNTLMLCLGASVALVACAQECPKTDAYDQVPYSNTRTAGLGTSVYDSKCAAVAEPVVEAPAPAPAPAPVLVPPAPVEPMPEPPVFKEQQTK